jgi:gliding motility-associated-like protein
MQNMLTQIPFFHPNKSIRKAWPFVIGVVMGLLVMPTVGVAQSKVGAGGTDQDQPSDEAAAAQDFVNVFTPNGDGINDVYRPAPGYFKRYTIRIYDRWGQQVFQGNQGQLWDGRTGDSRAPAGVYVYQIQGVNYKGNKVERTGTFLLMR